MIALFVRCRRVYLCLALVLLGHTLSDSSTNLVNPQRTLVIGGTGFMGRHVVQHLLDAGIDVDIMTDGRSVNPWGSRVKETVCDRHKSCLGETLQEGPWDLVVDFPVFETSDVEDIIRHSKWIRHYVFPSSDDAYMVCDRDRFEYGSTGGVLESSSRRPANVTQQAMLAKWDSYGDNKKRLEERFADSDLNFTALRLPDVWGPFESTGRFVTFLRALEQGKHIGLKIWSGNPVFPRLSVGELFQPGFVFARDVAQMVLLLLQSGPQQQPVNVAVEEMPTFMEMVIEAYKTLKDLSGTLPVGELAFAEDRAVPLLSTDIGPLDISRAKALGFEPTPWRQGWQETIEALHTLSRNETSAAAQLAKCISHCSMVCSCDSAEFQVLV